MRIVWQLFVTFFNIGAFTLGGGYAMLDMIERAVVDRHHWIEKEEFWDMITIVQMLPGVFAVNTALYTGYKIKGIRGAIAACLGAIIPSIVIILVIAVFFLEYKENPVVERIFRGIRPCVVALILSPSIKMFINAKVNWKTAVFPIATVCLIYFFRVSPVWIIIATIIGSLAFAFYSQKQLNKSKS